MQGLTSQLQSHPMTNFLDFLLDGEVTRLSGTSKGNKGLARTHVASGTLFQEIVQNYASYSKTYLVTFIEINKQYSTISEDNDSMQLVLYHLSSKVTRLRLSFPLLPYPQRFQSQSNLGILKRLADEPPCKKASTPPPRLLKRKRDETIPNAALTMQGRVLFNGAISNHYPSTFEILRY